MWISSLNFDAIQADSGHIPLTLAASKGDLMAMSRIAALGGDLNAVNRQGETALKVARDAGRLNVVQWLAVHGADLAVTTGNKATVLDDLVSTEDEIVAVVTVEQALVELKKLCPEITLETINGKYKDSDRSYLTHYIEQNDIKTAKLLVQAGADLYAVDGKSETPFILASKKPKLLHELLTVKANLQITETLPEEKQVITRGAIFTKVATKPSGNCLFEAIIKAIEFGKLTTPFDLAKLTEEVASAALPAQANIPERVELEQKIQALRNRIASRLIELRAVEGDELTNPGSIFNQVTTAFMDLLGAEELAGCPAGLLTAIDSLREQLKIDMLCEKAFVAYRRTLDLTQAQAKLAHINQLIADTIAKQKVKAQQFIKTTGFTAYVNAIKEYGTWAGGLELRLLARMLNVYVLVYGPEHMGGVLEEIEFAGCSQVMARQPIISPNPADDTPLREGKDIVIPEQSAVVTLCLSGRHYSTLLPGNIELQAEALPVEATAMDSSATIATIEEADDFIICIKFLMEHGFNTLALDTIHPEVGLLPITLAAALGDIETMQALVKQQGVNVILANQRITTLMAAAASGQFKMVAWLVANGANITAVNLAGATARDMAAEKEHKLIADFLAFAEWAQEEGFDQYELNAMLDNGELYLTYALKTNDADLLEMLFKLEELGIDYNKLNQDGYDALHLAVLQGNLLYAKKLIELGANPNAVNTHGDTVLDVALKANQPELVQYLKAKDAITAVAGYCTISLQALGAITTKSEKPIAITECLSLLHSFDNIFIHPEFSLEAIELIDKAEEELSQEIGETEELPAAIEYAGFKQLSISLLENYRAIQVRIERVQRMLGLQI